MDELEGARQTLGCLAAFIESTLAMLEAVPSAENLGWLVTGQTCALTDLWECSSSQNFELPAITLPRQLAQQGQRYTAPCVDPWVRAPTRDTSQCYGQGLQHDLMSMAAVQCWQIVIYVPM